MRDFERKRNVRRLLYSPLTLLALFFLLVLVGKATWGLYGKERESQKNLERVEAELLGLKLREEKLQASIVRLKTPEGIEAEIRKQFQVAKPGERMVVLVPDSKGEPEEKVEKHSLFLRLLDIFR